MDHDFDTLSLRDLQSLLSIPSDRHAHLLVEEQPRHYTCREPRAAYEPRHIRLRDR